MSYITLKEYIESLQQLVSNDSTLADLPLYMSLDDEGNYYRQVYKGIATAYILTNDLKCSTTDSTYSQDDMDLYFDSKLYTRIGIIS